MKRDLTHHKDNQVTRQQIIEAALKWFSHFGFDKTSLSDISRELPISTPAIYKYFAGKKEVIDAVVDQIFVNFLGEQQRAYAQESRLENYFEKFLMTRLKYFRQYHLLNSPHDNLFILDGFLSAEHHNTVINEYLRFFHSVFKKAIEKGEIIEVDVERITIVFFQALAGPASLYKSIANPGSEFLDKILINLQSTSVEIASVFLSGLQFQRINLLNESIDMRP